MKIVCIVGPYFSGGDPEKIEYNIRHAEQYAIALANRGIGFFCPHKHTEHFEVKAKAPESFYYELDMIFLRRVVDALLAIPGWEDSVGAQREVTYAKKHGIPVFYPNSPDDLDEIEKWAKGE